MANRVYEEMTKWPPKKQIFEFLVNLASKVSISTNSDPQITNLMIFCRFDKFSVKKKNLKSVN